MTIERSRPEFAFSAFLPPGLSGPPAHRHRFRGGNVHRSPGPAAGRGWPATTRPGGGRISDRFAGNDARVLQPVRRAGSDQYRREPGGSSRVAAACLGRGRGSDAAAAPGRDQRSAPLVVYGRRAARRSAADAVVGVGRGRASSAMNVALAVSALGRLYCCIDSDGPTRVVPDDDVDSSRCSRLSCTAAGRCGRPASRKARRAGAVPGAWPYAPAGPD